MLRGMPTAEVPLPGPLDVRASLEVFRRWGDDLVDRLDGEVLLRTLWLRGAPVAWSAEPAGDTASPGLRVTVDDPDHLEAAVVAARELFVTASEAFALLCAADPVVAAAEARHPGIRGHRDAGLLTALVRAISAQQVNLRWAATTRRRLARATGTVHHAGGREVWAFDAARLAHTDPGELRALQFTTSKAEYLVGVAAEVHEGRLELETMRRWSDSEVIDRLTAVRGLGRWTAEWILARALGRPRVVAGDLGVRRAVGLAYLGGRMPSEPEVRTLTAHWGDGAAVAQAVLLHTLVAPARP
jgi:DNA-3-methyladenine glycosylase II